MIKSIIFREKHFRSLTNLAKYYNIPLRTFQLRYFRKEPLEEALDLVEPIHCSTKRRNEWLIKHQNSKLCSRCKEVKTLDNFYKKNSKCKECTRIVTLEYQRERKFNFSKKDYEKLLVEQNYQCAICGKKEPEVKFHLDHCHKINKVRGILCHLCNPALGQFKDNITFMQNAINYLLKHKDD